MTIIHFITTDRDIHLSEIIRSLRNLKSCLDWQQLRRKTWRKDTDLSESTPDTVDFTLKRCKFTGRKRSHTHLNPSILGWFFLIFILYFVLIYQFISVKISDNKFSEGILEVRILSYQLSHTFTLTTYLVFYKYFSSKSMFFLNVCMWFISVSNMVQVINCIGNRRRGHGVCLNSIREGSWSRFVSRSPTKVRIIFELVWFWFGILWL